MFGNGFYSFLTAKSRFDSLPNWRHLKTRRQTSPKILDLYKKDFLAIPVCQDSHWILAMVCHPGLIKSGCRTLQAGGVLGKACELPAVQGEWLAKKAERHPHAPTQVRLSMQM